MKQAVEPESTDVADIRANQPRSAGRWGAEWLGRKWAALRRGLVSIPEREVLVATRGFDVRDPEIARRLEEVGRAFIAGCNVAVGTVKLTELQASLEQYQLSHRGFAYEGASMGLAIADFMTPFSTLWPDFAQGIGAPHLYMVHVGYGWALARLPVAPLPAMMRLDERFRWLAMDGYGFHQGYFHWPRYVREARPPAPFCPMWRKAPHSPPRRAGNPMDHCELACEILCSVSLEEAASVARACLPTGPQSGSPGGSAAGRPIETYEVWRTDIRKHFGAAG